MNKNIQISNIKMIFFLIAIGIITIQITACERKKTIPLLSENYDVIDSGLLVSKSINWMDNNRIITEGIDYDNSPETKIYIWDIEKNETVEYSNGGDPCYYDGYSYFGFKVDLPFTEEKPYGENWKEGPFTKEKIFTKIYGVKDGRKWKKDNVRNKFSCRLSKRPKEMEKHIWIPLLEEHGYLDFGKVSSSSKGNRIFLFRPDGSSFELPFNLEVGLLYGEYAPYKKAYFHWALVSSKKQNQHWKKTGCSIGWWIYPEELKVKSECIPYTPWRQSTVVIPTIKGFFQINYNYLRNEPRGSGGYLYINKKFKEVIKGWIESAKVSPDGCKVAVAHKLARATNMKVKMTLKVINICKDKE